MKIFYIANARIPTEKAHGIQIMKTCEAFASQRGFDAERTRTNADKIEVELVVPKRRNPIKAAPFDFYKVKNNFRVKKIFCIDLVGVVPKLGFWVESISFAKAAVWYVKSFAGIIYSRDALPLYLLSFFKKDLVWESHRGESNFMAKRLIKKCKRIIVITKGLKELYVSLGAKPDSILVAPDGVDLTKFQIPNSKFQIREELGLPQDKFIVAYTGHLYGWKGANVLLEAARLLSSPPHEEGQGEVLENMDTMTPSQSPPHEGEKKGVVFVFVGGTDSDIKKFKQKAEELGLLGQDIRGNQSSNSQESVNKSVEIRGQNQWKSEVLILGHKPHQEIPKYLAAADVLVLPTSGKSEIGRSYTSPMKMFEYMAAGKPIVASDIPALREILYDYPRQSTTPSPSVERVGERLKDSSQSAQYGNAILVKPDNPKALAEGIEKVLIDQTLARAIAAQAAEDAKQYTWETRARSILKFILWSYKP